MKTNKIIKDLKKYSKKYTIKEIVELINTKYGTNYTFEQIKYLKGKYKIKSKNDGRFKKGQNAHNHQEIGYQFIDKKTGYTYIKVKEPNVFVQMQRYVYEKHYGKIPSGYSVIFLNQNKSDFRIENLMLVRTKDKLVCKNKKMFSANPDITQLGLLNAKLINKIVELSK